MRLPLAVPLALAIQLQSTMASAVPDVPLSAPDVAVPANPGDVTLEWYMAERLVANEKGRLLAMDSDALLEGFRNRPGSQAWIGEHVGKWLHAACLSWAYSRTAALRKKIDLVVTELLKTQEPDGYLGTYVPEKRFGLHPGADWDVWVHKYAILGLLAAHEHRGSAEALEGARKAGDLLVATFGPGKRDIIAAGTHVGMAATSVLEPIVLLHRATGDAKYLEFAKYLVDAYEHGGGPRIVTSLLEGGGNVRRTANAKAYEMMSNLVGLCELYRVTGEKRYLTACELAWKDIVAHRMYVTGGVSLGEHFQEEGVLSNTGAVAETCANVTWEALNLQLLRLTGEAKYGDVLERIVFNHLLAAQRQDGAAICYFTPLEGTKAFREDINCCASSGPRGIALIPTFCFLGRADSVDVNLFVRGEATFALADGTTARVEGRTRFPSGNKLFVRVTSEGPGPVKYRVRVPSWSKPGGTFEDASWTEYSEEVRLELDLTPRIVKGTGGNAGKVAILRGPVVYCLDSRLNPDLKGPVALAGDTLEALGLDAVGAKDRALYQGQALLRAKGVRLVRTRPGETLPAVDLLLADFASAGAEGAAYRVWLPVAGSIDPSKLSMLAYGKESWSRPGNVEGSIADERTDTYRVTFDGRKADEDWFAVELDAPARISRVSFAHGSTFHDGGWFDASAGKPRVEVRKTPGGPWEAVATIDAYPATTAIDPAGLEAGRRFEVRLPAPIEAVGVRVIGRPASGDNPAQAFASASEIAAYGD